jgi:arylsulfatase A-like enzyme
VRCTNGYVSGPYCSPTRAGLLTGRYQTRFGHEFNPGGGGKAKRKKQGTGARTVDSNALDRTGLPLTETTMADRLKKEGYVTALVGKWHLGGSPNKHPQRRGFDEFYGFLGGAHGYQPGDKPPILRGKQAIDEKDYLTDAIGREGAAFVERNAERPFFLYLAFNAVHTPMHATDERLKKFADISDEKRRTYAAMMSAMDDAIGKVLGTVHTKNLDDRTLVVFISDNGGPTMQGTATNGSVNSPLRGSKRTTLEGGVRVPFLVKWPGRLPSATTYNEPVIQLDILPTILTAIGAEIPADAKLDGVNLLPYLTGESDGKPHDTLYWRFGQQMAIRQGDWKLVRYDPVVDGKSGRATEARLYNLASDIGEQRDLIDEQPEKGRALQAAWNKWNELNVPPLWGGNTGRDRSVAKRRPRAGAARSASSSSGE